MTGKELLQNNPLEIMVCKESVPAFLQIMEELNREHVLEYQSSDIHLNESYTVYSIHCPTTGFARAYWALGLAIGTARVIKPDAIGLSLITNNKIQHDGKRF